MEDVNTLGGTDDQDIRSTDKNPRFYDTGNAVQRYFQFARLTDAVDMHIDDHVPRLSFKRDSVTFPEHHAALGECCYFTRSTAPSKRDDFDRQGK